MALTDTELAVYPQEYLIEEDEMSESAIQFYLIKYLAELLEWYYRFGNCYVTGNLELYHPAITNSQHKITPDVLVFIGVVISPEERRRLTSWNIPNRGAPSVVFEISSRSTWEGDIQNGTDQKPAIYGRIGVREYWAYDPNDPAVWSGVEGRRLMGWRYDEAGQPHRIEEDERGWCWSTELDSWLAPDEEHLRLYDQAGQLRLRAKEAEAIARRAEQQARQAQKQAQRQAQAERQKAQAERQKAQAEQQKAQAEQQKAQAEREAFEQRIAQMESELRRLKGEA